MEAALRITDLSKTFTLHTQGGAQIPVFADLDLEVKPGRCLALHGPSGSGKSSLLKSMYANYLPQQGRILVRHQGRIVDLAAAQPRQVLEVRKKTIGYVSQFLRVIPRVPSLEIVAEPLIGRGMDRAEALDKARSLLLRLNIPAKMFSLAPATFSGGEQQRVNVARGFAVDYPVLLLDEPTASLDPVNTGVVIELINQAKARGAAIAGIFHDAQVRRAVADDILEMGSGR